MKQFPNRFVFYSLTEQNPFLDPAYIEQLRRDLSPKEVLRYLKGQWIELSSEVVYYEYDPNLQYVRKPYEINPKETIYLAFDFNIGEGKPMSMACIQYINDTFHIFNQVVIHGSRTVDTIEELDGKGLFNKEWRYGICGDASGSSRDTRSSRSDYDIIKAELSKRNLRYDYLVPPANPPIRHRHNRVNSYCLNSLGERRLFVYADAPTADEGFRLTKLKSRGGISAGYIEDDSKEYQHITTAIGYCIMFLTRRIGRPSQGTVEF